MSRPCFAAVLTAAAGLVLAACSESSDSSPTSPMSARAGTAALSACNAPAFRDARGFARSLFEMPTEGVAVDLIDDMEDSADPIRTAKGLDLFELVALGTDVVGTLEDGSNLLNIVAACSDLGLTADIDWTGPLGPQGALAVVGDGSDNESGSVYSKDFFSGVAPPGGPKDWSAWLRLPDNVPPDLFPDPRAVVFGAPFDVSESDSPEVEVSARGFGWNVLPPRDFPFGRDDNDDGFVGLCVTSTGTDRVQNNHSATITGLLGVPASDPLSLLTCEDFDDAGRPPESIGMFRRVMDLLSPRPAYAAALVAGKTGGTAGGFSRHFVVKPNALQVKVETIKDANVQDFLNAPEGVKVTVTTIPPPPATVGVPLQRALLTAEIAGNNGLPANFTGDKDVLTDEFGVAIFTDLQLFSAGGYTARFTVTDGLNNLPQATGFSNAFHIKNKKK